MKEAEIVASRDQLNIAKLNTQIEQSKLVHTYLNELTSENESVKKIAIEAVLIALPEAGPRLVSSVAKTDSSAEIREFAEKQLFLHQLSTHALRICSPETKSGQTWEEGKLVKEWSHGYNFDEFKVVNIRANMLFIESPDQAFFFLYEIENNKWTLEILNLRKFSETYPHVINPEDYLEKWRECNEAQAGILQARFQDVPR